MLRIDSQIIEKIVASEKNLEWSWSSKNNTGVKILFVETIWRPTERFTKTVARKEEYHWRKGGRNLCSERAADKQTGKEVSESKFAEFLPTDHMKHS